VLPPLLNGDKLAQLRLSGSENFVCERQKLVDYAFIDFTSVKISE